MSQFSGNTFIELVDALELSTHAKITTFLIRFDMEEADNQSSVESRKLGIIEYLRDHPEKKAHLELIWSSKL
jgi:hypothetical protein